MGDRQSGRTLAAIQSAPRAAIYIWCNDQLNYPRRMARWAKRSDLVIVGPGNALATLRARNAPVIVDHAAILPLHILELVDDMNARYGRAA